MREYFAILDYIGRMMTPTKTVTSE